jgi:hypothetical protein
MYLLFNNDLVLHFNILILLAFVKPKNNCIMLTVYTVYSQIESAPKSNPH